MSKKSELTEVLELEDESLDTSRVVLLLEEAIELKRHLDKQVEGSIAWRYEEARDELNELLVQSGQDGFRHGNLVYTSRMMDGRKSVDVKVLRQELLLAGVDLEVIDECIQTATKEGAPYWVREVSVLRAPVES